MTTTEGNPDTSEFLRSLSWRGAMAVAGLAGSFVITVLGVRLLPLAVTPTFYLTLTALMVAPMLGRLGVSTAAIAELSALRASGRTAAAPSVVRRALLSTFLASTAAALVIAFAVVSRTPEENRWVLGGLVAALLFSESVRLASSDLLSGLGRPAWSALMAHQPRAAIGAVAVALYAAVVERASLTGVLTVLALVSTGLTIAGLWCLATDERLRGWHHRGSTRTGGELALRATVPVLLVDLALFGVSRLDVWIASMGFAAEEAVRYSTASVVAMQLGLPIGLVAVAIAPLVAGLAARGELERLEAVVRTVATASVALFLPMIGVLAAAGPWLFGMLFGAAYRDAATLCVVLSLGSLALAAAGLAQPVLVMTGQARPAAALAVAVVVAWVPVGWLTAAVAGPIALAVVSAGATTVLHVGFALLVRRALGVCVLPWGSMARLQGGLRASRTARPQEALA